MFPGLVHPARHVMKAGNTRSRWANRKEAAVEGGVGDWDEVVTRKPYRKVRLDHLLSREIRVPTLRWGRGVEGSQVDRTVISCPRQVGNARASARTFGETDCDLATTPKPIRHPDRTFLSLFTGQGCSRRRRSSVDRNRSAQAPAGV